MSSIRDVARQAGVSPATVSRILNNDPTYKATAETRQRVLKTATELDYKPLVRRCRKNKPQSDSKKLSIGCVIVSTKGRYSDPYYMAILSGIEQELEKLGGAVTLVRTAQELANQEVLDGLLDTPLDGLVLMCQVNGALFERLHQKFPHIVGIDTGYMPIDSVEYDHTRVSRMAVEYLYGKGHREIGFIGGGSLDEDVTKSRRFRSYCETMMDLGLTVNRDWVVDCAWDDKLCMKGVSRILSSGHVPTAFYAASDLMAMAALRALYLAKVRVPEEVAVIGMSNIEMSQYANPPLTTIDVPTHELGVVVAQVLISRINGDASLHKHILLPSELIERDSV